MRCSPPLARPLTADTTSGRVLGRAAEDRIFEANQATESAEADAIEADEDAARFETQAKELERRYKEGKEVVAKLTEEIASLKDELAALRAQVATKPTPAAPSTETEGQRASPAVTKQRPEVRRRPSAAARFASKTAAASTSNPVAPKPASPKLPVPSTTGPRPPKPPPTGASTDAPAKQAPPARNPNAAPVPAAAPKAAQPSSVATKAAIFTDAAPRDVRGTCPSASCGQRLFPFAAVCCSSIWPARPFNLGIAFARRRGMGGTQRYLSCDRRCACARQKLLGERRPGSRPC